MNQNLLPAHLMNHRAGLTNDQAEYLGRLADRLDSALYSAKLPLPPATHVSALTAIIREVRNELAALVREEAGNDPWADNPLEG